MEEPDQRNEEIVSSKAEIKVTSGSWNVRKRLYPPFRERREGVRAEADEQQQPRQKVNESSASEPGLKFRGTICLRKKQFPLICTNISPDNQRIVTPFDNDNDTSDDTPICGPDSEPCLIANGTSPSNDVCRDANKSIEDYRLDLASDKVDKSESQWRMTFDCGESIDYIICGSCCKELSSSILSADGEDAEVAFHGFRGADEYSEFQEEDYDERSAVTSNRESKSNSESTQNAKLLQDPLVSHRLTMPYKEMPLSRYCINGSFNDFEKIIFLGKRAQSPLRDIPEGRFDVRAKIAEVTKRVKNQDDEDVQRVSKESMAGEQILDFKSPTSDSDLETLKVLLKALLGKVELSQSDYENDLSITLTTVWTIKELEMSKEGSKVTESITIANLGVIPRSKRSLSYNLTLLTAAYETSDVGYPPKGSGNHSLHRALPWLYLCAAHAEGEQKAYDTVRTCIDKVSPQIEPKKSTAVYLPDMSCPHSKEPVSFRGRIMSVESFEKLEEEETCI